MKPVYKGKMISIVAWKDSHHFFIPNEHVVVLLNTEVTLQTCYTTVFDPIFGIATCYAGDLEKAT